MVFRYWDRARPMYSTLRDEAHLKKWATDFTLDEVDGPISGLLLPRLEAKAMEHHNQCRKKIEQLQDECAVMLFKSIITAVQLSFQSEPKTMAECLLILST